MKKLYLRGLIAVLWSLQTLLLVGPVQAANRNDFLFNLKDTFNSPASQKFSVNSFIVTLVFVLLLGLFFYYNSREQNVRRTSRKLNREKVRRQMNSNQQLASNQHDRKWFRIKTRAEFRWILADQAAKVKMNRYKIDHLIDISGGGMCFSTAEKLKLGDEIRIILSTGKGEPLLLNGKVTRVSENNADYNISVEFVGIRDGHRDRIVAWIIAGQRSAIHEQKPEKD